jgi:hypothetical protein
MSHEQEQIVSLLRDQARADAIKVTAHAHQEMAEDDVSLDDVLSVLKDAVVVENYPEHRRGSCCLVCGQASDGRHIHVVCTTSLEAAVIITVYVPKPPKWVSPLERGRAL